ncbi:hypothetical protein CHCC14427_0021 [Bacillus paralicheniformis]|nr:hypothetical protein CHCC14427_0021 [Bacillus paralicheniformis]
MTGLFILVFRGPDHKGTNLHKAGIKFGIGAFFSDQAVKKLLRVTDQMPG